MTASIRSASPRGSGMRAQNFQGLSSFLQLVCSGTKLTVFNALRGSTSRRPRGNVEVQMEKVLRVVLRLHVDETLVVRTVRCTNRV